MEMDGGMKKFHYFHSSFPCWSEANLLFHEAFVVVACVGRCQGLWYFPHLCYSTFLHFQMRSIFEKWSYLYYQHGTCVLNIWRNQLALFGNFFCNFVVINIWLFLWHIQDMLAWCTCRPPFRWWPPFWFCHLLFWIFWCTFLTLSIVTRFQQQPFERTYTPRHECVQHRLELFPRLFVHLLQLGSSTSIEYKKHHCFQSAISTLSIVGH